MRIFIEVPVPVSKTNAWVDVDAIESIAPHGRGNGQLCSVVGFRSGASLVVRMRPATLVGKIDKAVGVAGPVGE